MFTYKNRTDLSQAHLVVGDLVQVLGISVEGDSATQYGLVRDISYNTQAEVVSLASNNKVELFPAASATGFDDLSQGTYLTQPTAITRSLQDKFSETFNIRDYGAVGDGVTDDYDAIQACADAAVAYSISNNCVATVYVPSGDYLISKRVVFDVQRGAGPRGITLKGESSDTSRLIAHTDNTEGCVMMTSTGNIELWQVRDIAFASGIPIDSDYTNGTALYIDSTLGPGVTGYGTQANRSVIITGVKFVAYGTGIGEINGGAYGLFHTRIHLKNKWFAFLNNVYIYGLNDLRPLSYAGILLENCYSPEIGNTYIMGCMTYGISVVAGTEEDFRLGNSFIVGPEIGFSIEHPDSHLGTLYECGGSILNCHMNCKKHCIHIKYHRQIIISGCYFYVPAIRNYEQSELGRRAAIWGEGVADLLVQNNEFLEPGYFYDTDTTSIGVYVTVETNGLLVKNNHFNCGGVGVFVAADSGSVSNAIVSDNTYGGQKVWTALTHKIIDESNKVISDVLTYTSQSTVFDREITKPHSGGATAQRTLYYSNNVDYSSNSTSSWYETSYLSNKSDGSRTSIVHKYNWTDNSADNPQALMTTYFPNVTGLAAVQQLRRPVDHLTTSLVLSVNIDGSTSLKGVRVGEPDSGGTGYRALTIIN